MKLKKRIEALESWQAVAATATSRNVQPGPRENTPSEVSETPNRNDTPVSPAESATPIHARYVKPIAVQQLTPPANSASTSPEEEDQPTVQQLSHVEHPPMDWTAPSYGDLTVEGFADGIDFVGDDGRALSSVWGTPKAAQAENSVVALSLQSRTDRYESLPRLESAYLPTLPDQASDEVRA